MNGLESIDTHHRGVATFNVQRSMFQLTFRSSNDLHAWNREPTYRRCPHEQVAVILVLGLHVRIHIASRAAPVPSLHVAAAAPSQTGGYGTVIEDISGALGPSTPSR